MPGLGARGHAPRFPFDRGQRRVRDGTPRALEQAVAAENVVVEVLVQAVQREPAVEFVGRELDAMASAVPRLGFDDGPVAVGVERYSLVDGALRRRRCAQTHPLSGSSRIDSGTPRSSSAASRPNRLLAFSHAMHASSAETRVLALTAIARASGSS